MIEHSRMFYDGPTYVGLPLGMLGEHGLPVRTESLAFTDAFLDELFPAGTRPPYLDPAGPTWTADYPAEFRDMLRSAGYVHYRDGEVPGSPGGYYLPSSPAGATTCTTRPRRRAGCRSARWTRSAPRAASSTTSTTCCRSRTTDPAGLVTEAGYDLRVLQPRRGHRRQRQHQQRHLLRRPGSSPADSCAGKDGEGDATAPSVAIDLRPARVRRATGSRCRCARSAGCTTTPSPDAARRGDRLGRVLRRVRAAAADPDPGRGQRCSATSTSAARSIPAEPGSRGRRRRPAAARRPTTSSSAAGRSTTTRAGSSSSYEPFFATGFDFAAPGRRPARAEGDDLLRPARPRDPHGQPGRQRAARRARRAGRPRRPGRASRRRRGRRFTYDANDNAGRTHPAEAAAYRDHWDTPSSIVVDALGRTVVDRRPQRRPKSSSPARATTSRATWWRSPTRSAARRSATGSTWPSAGGGWTASTPAATTPCPTRSATPSRSATRKGALTLGGVRRAAPPDPGVGARRRRPAGDAATAHRLRRRRRPASAAAGRGRATCSGRAVAHHDEAGLVTVERRRLQGQRPGLRPAGDRRCADPRGVRAGRGRRLAGHAVHRRLGAGPRTDLLDAGRSTGPRPATTRSTGSTRHLLPVDVEGRRRELVPSYNRAGGLERVTLDDAGVRRADRLRRQGPADARSPTATACSPATPTTRTRSGWPGCAPSTTRPTGRPTARPGRRCRTTDTTTTWPATS